MVWLVEPKDQLVLLTYKGIVMDRITSDVTASFTTNGPAATVGQSWGSLIQKSFSYLATRDLIRLSQTLAARGVITQVLIRLCFNFFRLHDFRVVRKMIFNTLPSQRHGILISHTV
jgi:hypothetical protein